MTSCDHTNELRDYALDELHGPQRAAFEQHLAGCAGCARELEALHLTTSALRALPDREIPQRIAFVSDRIFAPSPWSRFFNGRLGFASASVLAAAVIISAYHKPAAAPVVAASAGPTRAEIAQQIDDAVTKAVAQVHAEDVRTTEAALKAVDDRHAKEYRNLMVAMDENMSVIEKRRGYETAMSNDPSHFGAAQ